MLTPLNYTAKVIDQLGHMDTPNAGCAQGFAYLRTKLMQAQVFILPDYGTLVDRGQARPVLPGDLFRPPFPSVSLEYTAEGPSGRMDGPYTAMKSSRRVALAFEWQNDLPPILRALAPRNLADGVMVASIFWSDEQHVWMPVSAAMHFAYDDIDQRMQLAPTPFVEAMIASNRISKAAVAAGSIAGQLVPILPEVIGASAGAYGRAVVTDSLHADLMDEVNAYFDLCAALGCRNVSAERHPAPEKLNRARIKAGRMPLPDFHVLTLGDGGRLTGVTGETGGTGRRAHLRRGHIRRLSPTRLTWVNQTMVRGSGGFVGKAYAFRAAAA